MTMHECGCSVLGPGPHPVDARHPNPRACEHAEWPEASPVNLRAALAEALDAIDGDIINFRPGRYDALRAMAEGRW